MIWNLNATKSKTFMRAQRYISAQWISMGKLKHSWKTWHKIYVSLITFFYWLFPNLNTSGLSLNTTRSWTTEHTTVLIYFFFSNLFETKNIHFFRILAVGYIKFKSVHIVLDNLSYFKFLNEYKLTDERLPRDLDFLFIVQCDSWTARPTKKTKKCLIKISMTNKSFYIYVCSI